ncbi:MAG TPA: septum site-determining protein MinC [Methylococcus sp.]|nr:septum site-determining protein MinC [Methylococcus sp.]
MPDASLVNHTPFEIRAGSFNLPVLKLMIERVEAIAEPLADRIRQAPDFFRHAPIIIDLYELSGQGRIPDFAALLEVLRGCGLTPVGVRGGDPEQNAAADAVGLALLAEGKTSETPPERKTPEPVATPEVSPPPRGGTRIIDQPVRSGQRVYASDGDLIVIATVSPGAELMADGNIHVYGSLRGRALAGVKGNTDSRIFCLDLQAELIAIGGHYKVSENLDGAIRGKPVQVALRDKALIIQEL